METNKLVKLELIKYKNNNYSNNIKQNILLEKKYGIYTN